MNRKDRRAAGVKLPKPALRDIVTALCLAAPWIIRTRWPPRFGHSLEMSFAGRAVLKRHQYGADLTPCVLVIGNAAKTMCVGDNRAGYDLLARRGHFGKVPSFHEWQSGTLLGGDANGAHIVMRAYSESARAFADLTFGQVAIKTNGAIEVPPAFAGFGDVEWPSAKMGDVWFTYTEAPEPKEMQTIVASDWTGLIDDLATLVDIALGYRNDEQRFVAEMQRQMQQMGR